MINYKPIFDQLYQLRLQKKNFHQCYSILEGRGHDRGHIKHVIGRVKKEEEKDYNRVSEFADNISYKLYLPLCILLLVFSIGLFSIPIWFATKCYKIAQMPSVIEKGHLIIKLDGMNKGTTVIIAGIFAFMTFMGVLQLLAYAIGKLRQLQKDRERFLYLEERR